MSRFPSIDRRSLLVGGGVGIGLIVAYAAWPRRPQGSLPTIEGERAFGSYLKIARDGRVTIAVPQVETGQGIWTAIPQIAADELGAAWESVAVEPAPLVDGYANPLARNEGWTDRLRFRAWPLGPDERMRITAGATSVRAFEQPLRDAATLARTLLTEAAADRWGADAAECEAADNLILHRGKTLTFGELAEEAAERAQPWAPPLLRGIRGSRLIGRPLPRLDGPAKADGSLRFATDVRLPEMLFASARLAPPGGRLTGFSRAAVRNAEGVRHLVVRDGWIAVVADSWWAAEQALKDTATTFSASSTPERLRSLYEDALATGDSESWFSRGDYDGATRDARALAATYFVAPSQHLGLEPLSATARFSDRSLEVWAPTQAPALARKVAARAASLPAEDVLLYPMPVGEPAGRALEADAIPIAVELAREARRPVQLSLPQSIGQNHDRLSPGALARVTALPGQGGITSAWRMRLATADGFAASIARMTQPIRRPLFRRTGRAGATPPYSIPDVDVAAVAVDLPIRVGYMRGSPHREYGFFTESFIDELARAAGHEPLAFRMAMLGGNGRLARCLQAAARTGQWDGGGRGSTMGIAGWSAFGSHIGLVATASVGAHQQVEVHKLVAAVECGRIVNSGLVKQQVAGDLLWALAQGLVPTPQWIGGMPRARAFGGIAVPRIRGTPEIMVQLIASEERPGGISGLASAVLAPAVANAIFSGTGRRLRDLPFDLAAAA